MYMAPKMGKIFIALNLGTIWNNDFNTEKGNDPNEWAKYFCKLGTFMSLLSTKIKDLIDLAVINH